MMDEILEGVVERITFYNTENGYTVLRLKASKGTTQQRAASGLVTVVGTLPEMNVGESVRFEGAWTAHAKHGVQFQANIAHRILPGTLEGVRRYLGSGLIKGVGPKTAERIVAAFGEDTLTTIEQQPERLMQIPGIGREKALSIHQQWQQQQAIQQVMIFLQSHGITTGLAVKIFKQYGDNAMTVLERDPYQLARDIWGVGFKTADNVAQQMGLPEDAPARLEAGLVHVLDTLTNDGHVYSPQTALFEQAAHLLNIAPEGLTAALHRLAEKGQVMREPLPDDNHAIYLTPLYYAERGVAQRLQKLLSYPGSRLAKLRSQPVDALLAAAQSNVALSPSQLRGLAQAIQHKVSVITGGPGTGKTTALRALIEVLKREQYTIALASPTGRAARRLAESTGQPASTIHRLLGYQPDGFKFNAETPLECDILIIDEASMIDLTLMHSVLKALPPDSHLVLVGDVDQLPAVGAGDVLRNIIDSGAVAITRLDVIFRQSGNSYIVENAHRVNRGELPSFEREAEDFFIFEFDDVDEVGKWVVDVVQQRIPRKFGLDPIRDVQVLSPMYRTAAGVDALNSQLQAALNPAGAHAPERKIGQTVYRVGDKVMQLRNNYEKDVFNGDIGRISAIDGHDMTLTAVFEGTPVVYQWAELDELTHAFAISVHKSQGSEYPAVVIPLVTQHYVMLQRNLLYTAITRAKKLCVLVGSKKALALAVTNNRVSERNTRLAERLRGELS